MSNIDRRQERIIIPGSDHLRSKEIPLLVAGGVTLPEAWENALLQTWHYGTTIPTEYDQNIDPESRDATLVLQIADPFAEPRIHKAIPDSFEGLYIYTQEVVNGVHDDRVKEGGWSYSYYDRLTNWPGIGNWIDMPHINQLAGIVNVLSETPYSRRAQAITWIPPVDLGHYEPPCLQRVWCRVIKSESDLYLLDMNTHWRSRDAFKAALMNMFAFTELQRIMAEQISVRSSRNVQVGRYVDISDSYHIYGSYERRGEVIKFINRLERSDLESRTYRSDDPIVLEEFERGRQSLLNK